MSEEKKIFKIVGSIVIMAQQCIQTYTTRRVCIGRSTKITNTGYHCTTYKETDHQIQQHCNDIFYQATIFRYTNFQKTDSIKETLKSKQAFELMVKQRIVKIKAYHADNGIF